MLDRSILDSGSLKRQVPSLYDLLRGLVPTLPKKLFTLL
jgi:hypothetical protein